MIAAIYTLYIINCLFLILTVLLQAGRGGGLSFAGGSGGGSATVFGASGASTFMQKLTVASAVMFMTLSLLLAYLSTTAGSVGEGEFIDPSEMTEGTEGAQEAPPAQVPTTNEVAPEAAPATNE